jgi:hypothetical protein
MIRVKLLCNWTHDSALRDYFNLFSLASDYTWKDMVLVDDDAYDFVAILNHAQHNNFDKSKAILFQCEPISTRKWWKYEDLDKYYAVYDTDRFFNFVTPHVYTPYMRILNDKPKKEKLFCGIVSDYESLEGHRLRKSFINNYLSKLDYYDHYGKGQWGHLQNFVGSCSNKYECLSKYKYHFNIENSFEKNYFTEKLVDAVLAECLCFYDGCMNIEDFIDPSVYIKIDIKNPENALQKIQESIAKNEYDKRIVNIRRIKQEFLTEYNPLNNIYKICLNKTLTYKV